MSKVALGVAAVVAAIVAVALFALWPSARPRIEDIVAFRVPGDRVIKLHVATWHAGPHFVHDECLFVNLENLDTNRRDFHAVPLPAECRYRL